MEFCIFPMQCINITQRANSPFSHKNLQALDIAGKDSGIESVYAPCTVKALAKWGTSNTVIFGSCDERGKATAVITENGDKRIVSFAFTHDNSISEINIGTVYKSGAKIYEEGTKGNATGNHVHMEVAEGWQYKKHLKSDGTWELDNITSIADIFYQLENWNEEKFLNGYTFKKVMSRNEKETYNIIFNVGLSEREKVENMPTNQTHISGENTKLNASVPFTAHYKFDHWNSQPDGTGYSYMPGEDYDKDWSSTLFACWMAKDISLEYMGNADGESVTDVPSTQFRKYNGEPLYISHSVPKRDGYTFSHWNSQQDDSGYIYNPNDIFDHDWNTCLHAQWIKTVIEKPLTLADAFKAFQSIAGKITLTDEEKQKYDINGDGNLNLEDAIKIFKNIAGK